MSSAEAEYVSLSACCAQVLWMRTQLTNYGFHFDKIHIYCDSKATIAISCNPVQHSRTKHIDVRYHFIKEKVEKGIVELFFARTEYQLADLFIKALPEERFKCLVRRLDDQGNVFRGKPGRTSVYSKGNNNSVSKKGSCLKKDSCSKGVVRVRNCILGLASLRNWQQIVQKDFGIKNAKQHVAEVKKVQVKAKERWFSISMKRSGDRHQPTSQQSSHRSHDHHNERHGSDRRAGSDNHRSSNNNYSSRIPVMDGTRETGVISPTDLPILVLSNPGVLLRVTLIQFALLVDVDTKESVVELQALASNHKHQSNHSHTHPHNSNDQEHQSDHQYNQDAKNSHTNSSLEKQYLFFFLKGWCS
nr:Gag-Pol polyprotein [Tanacetum cinerariifolium]